MGVKNINGDLNITGAYKKGGTTVQNLRCLTFGNMLSAPYYVYIMEDKLVALLEQASTLMQTTITLENLESVFAELPSYLQIYFWSVSHLLSASYNYDGIMVAYQGFTEDSDTNPDSMFIYVAGTSNNAVVWTKQSVPVENITEATLTLS